MIWSRPFSRSKIEFEIGTFDIISFILLDHRYWDDQATFRTDIHELLFIRWSNSERKLRMEEKWSSIWSCIQDLSYSSKSHETNRSIIRNNCFFHDFFRLSVIRSIMISVTIRTAIIISISKSLSRDDRSEIMTNCDVRKSRVCEQQIIIETNSVIEKSCS